MSDKIGEGFITCFVNDNVKEMENQRSQLKKPLTIVLPPPEHFKIVHKEKIENKIIPIQKHDGHVNYRLKVWLKIKVKNFQNSRRVLLIYLKAYIYFTFKDHTELSALTYSRCSWKWFGPQSACGIMKEGGDGEENRKGSPLEQIFEGAVSKTEEAWGPVDKLYQNAMQFIMKILKNSLQMTNLTE